MENFRTIKIYCQSQFNQGIFAVFLCIMICFSFFQYLEEQQKVQQNMQERLSKQTTQRYSIFKNDLFPNTQTTQQSKKGEESKNTFTQNMKEIPTRAISSERNSRTKPKIFSQPKILESKENEINPFEATTIHKRQRDSSRERRRTSKIFSQVPRQKLQITESKIDHQPYLVCDAVQTQPEPQFKPIQKQESLKLKLIKTFGFEEKRSNDVSYQINREKKVDLDVMTPYQFAKLLKDSKNNKLNRQSRTSRIESGPLSKKLQY